MIEKASFGLKMAIKWPTLVDGASLRSAATSASALLENYPYPTFFIFVRKMIAKVSEFEQASGGGGGSSGNEVAHSRIQTQRDQHNRGTELTQGLEDKFHMAVPSGDLFEDWPIGQSFMDAWGFPELGCASIF